jgi:serine/threonine-protein kinase RsbW
MDSTTQHWRYDDHIPSEPDCCATIVRMVLEQLEKNGWGNKDTFGIHMAMEEAIMNAIDHGNNRSPDKTVHLVIEICGDRFYSKITDQGEGFDPTKVPDPTDEENLEKDCGRGVMLIKNFVDVVLYNDKGNSLELTKQNTESNA